MTDEQPQPTGAAEAPTPKPARARRKPREVTKSTAKPSSNQKKKPAARARAKAARPGSKTAKVIALLKRSSGATLAQLMKATGWQAHSVRGAISGAIKKKLGLTVTSVKTNGVRTYRISA